MNEFWFVFQGLFQPSDELRGIVEVELAPAAHAMTTSSSIR
jgi:hypothetical protein